VGGGSTTKIGRVVVPRRSSLGVLQVKYASGDGDVVCNQLYGVSIIG